MVRRRLVFSVVTVVVLILAAGAPYLARSLSAANTVADATAGSVNYGSVPAYTLTDQHGRQVRASQFRGKVQVLSFLFPYCTTYCPIITRRLAQLEQALAAGHLDRRVQLVSFNVDPAGAGPVQMAQFLREFGGDPASPDWEFLTGTPAQIHRLVYRDLGIYFQRESLAAEDAQVAKEKKAGTYTPGPSEVNPIAVAHHVTYDVVHNDYLEVVTPTGRIVDLFDNGDQVTVAQLMSAVRDVLAGRAPPAQSSFG